METTFNDQLRFSDLLERKLIELEKATVTSPFYSLLESFKDIVIDAMKRHDINQDEYQYKELLEELSHTQKKEVDMLRRYNSIKEKKSTIRTIIKVLQPLINKVVIDLRKREV
jgi:hypothetical protein